MLSFSCDVLCWLLVLLSVLLKDDCKISVLFEQIQNFKILNLAMAKVKKVNIAVTYNGSLKIGYRFWHSGRTLASSSLGRGFKSRRRRENGEKSFVRFSAETATSRQFVQFSADWLRLFFRRHFWKSTKFFLLDDRAYFGAMTLGITTFSIVTLSIVKFTIIKKLKRDTQHYGRTLLCWVSFMLTVTHAECYI